MAAAPGSASALFVKKAVSSVTKTVEKAADKVAKTATDAKDKVVSAAKDAGSFFQRIASKTGEAFSAAGLQKLGELAASTWKSVRDKVKQGYEASVAKVKRLVTDLIQSRLIQKAKADVEKTWQKVRRPLATLKSLLEDRSARDRIWRMLKTFASRKIDAQSREDLAWVAQKLGFPKKGGKGASRRVADDRAMCGFLPWPKSLCISIALSGTLAKGIGVTAEGVIGGCLDLGVDGSFADNYNLGIVASIGGGIAGGVLGANLDVVLSLNAKPVSQLDGAYIGVSGELHAKYGASLGVDWDIGAENFTSPSLDHLIPSVSVAAGVGKGGKVALSAGYSFILVQRKG
jgi:hypothetical protein